MSDFQKQALSAFKANMAGLPSFCRLVLYEIFEYIDFSSGTISIISLEKFAFDYLQVTPLRGRQKEVINGDTIRNAFRAIKKAKPDHFKFTTVNQRIIIDMPFLRELYQSIHGETPEVAAVLAVNVAAATTLAQSSEYSCFEPFSTGDVAGELAAASLNESINVHDHACVKIKTNFKTNKQTNRGGESFAEIKKPISRNFHPTQETIDLALSKGFMKVTSDIEIKRFIMYNLASATLWADYNPVFLNWLERDYKRDAEQTSETLTQHHLRKNSHERSINKVRDIKPTVADTIKRNQQIIDDHNQQQANYFIDGEYCESVAISGGSV